MKQINHVKLLTVSGRQHGAMLLCSCVLSLWPVIFTKTELVAL